MEQVERELRAGHGDVFSAIAAKDAHEALRDSFHRSIRRNYGATAEAKHQIRLHNSCVQPRRHRVENGPRGRRTSLACAPPAQPPPRKARPRRHSADDIRERLDPCAAHWLVALPQPSMTCSEPQGRMPIQMSLPGSVCGQPNQPVAKCSQSVMCGRSTASELLSSAVQARIVPYSARHGYSSTCMETVAIRRINSIQTHKTQRHSSRCCGMVVYAAAEAVRYSLRLPSCAPSVEVVVVLMTVVEHMVSVLKLALRLRRGQPC